MKSNRAGLGREAAVNQIREAKAELRRRHAGLATNTQFFSMTPHRRAICTVIMIYNGLMYNGQGSNFAENKGQQGRVRAEIRKLTDDHFFYYKI